jgi:hypothetical protein
MPALTHCGDDLDESEFFLAAPYTLANGDLKPIRLVPALIHSGDQPDETTVAIAGHHKVD